MIRQVRASTWIVMLAVLAMAVGLGACNSSSNSSSSTTPPGPTGTTYVFDEGNGQTSTVTLYASSYVNHKSNGYQETGSVTHLSDGFLQIIKETTTDPNDTDVLPHTYYGLEVPDTALFVVDPRGISGATNLPPTGDYIANMVGVNNEGQCPAAGTELLAMAATDPTWLPDSNVGAYGKFDFKGASAPSDVASDVRILAEDFSGATQVTDPAGAGGLHSVTCKGAVATGTEGTITFSKSGFGQLNWTGGGGYLLLPGASTLPGNLTYTQLIADLEATGRRFHGIHMKPWQSMTGGAYDTMDATFVVGAGNFGATAVTAAGYTDVSKNQVDLVNGGDIVPLPSTTVQSSGPVGVLDNSTVVGTTSSRIVATQLNGRWVIFGIDSPGGTNTGTDWETFYLVEDDTPYTAPPNFGSDTVDGPYIFTDNSGSTQVQLDLTSGTWVHDDGATSTMMEWGTLQQLSNGFLKLDLQESTQLDTTAPETFAALELPGSLLQAFMTDPQTGIQSAMTGLIAGTCPDAVPLTSPIHYNQITVPNESDPILDTQAVNNDNESYGAADLTWTNSTDYALTPTTTLWNRIADGTTFNAPTALGSGACTSGNIVFGASTTSMAFLPSGFAYVQDSTAGVDGNLLMPQDGTTPDATVQYQGWSLQGVYDTGSSSWRSEATPIWAAPGTTAGTLTAGPYTDVLNNTKDPTQSGTINLVTAGGSNGLYPSGTATPPTGPSLPFPYMVATDTLTGKKMIYGVFYDSSVNTTQQSNWQAIFLFQQ